MAEASILLIDDDDVILDVLTDLLELRGFEVLTASEGRAGIEAFRKNGPDLVITDISMPHMDGLQVLHSVREMDECVPVILVTGHGDLNNALKALRRGAYDFLLKPINPEILLNTVVTGVEHCRLKRFEKDYRRILEQQVEARTKDLMQSYETIQRIQEASIFALAKLAESRDDETGLHLKRLQAYCKALCQQLQSRSLYRDLMTDDFIDNIVRSSVLHDIGKVAIPDDILFSSDKFAMDEFEIMKQHSVYGGKALEEAAFEVGGDENYLSMGKDVAYYHHEHWDGNGYPFGLRGEEIPLAARIVSLADVYDALTTQRRYREACTHEEAIQAIVNGRGTQFDPEIVDALLQVEKKFHRIHEQLSASFKPSSNHSRESKSSKS
ncbi:MAG TPA: HD domain-containing phosphohydrolase [Desulfomonilaceae bacterium]|nr:HD domain-containing phosphohydrolase [Desulfomonilaceae bacterium]